MIGHDVRNTRSQPDEVRIDEHNVRRLMPKWEATTAGNVSATPAVITEPDAGGHRSNRDRDRAVFFPDWGESSGN